jgi:integrase
MTWMALMEMVCQLDLFEGLGKNSHFGAHDLSRTCAKLCRKGGDDLDQIKFLLGHSSIQTTERYLGSEQEIAIAVNDSLGL